MAIFSSRRDEGPGVRGWEGRVILNGGFITVVLLEGLVGPSLGVTFPLAVT